MPRGPRGPKEEMPNGRRSLNLTESVFEIDLYNKKAIGDRIDLGSESPGSQSWLQRIKIHQGRRIGYNRLRYISCHHG